MAAIKVPDFLYKTEKSKNYHTEWVVVVPQGSLQGRHRKTSIAYNIIWYTTPFVEAARMSDVTST